MSETPDGPRRRPRALLRHDVRTRREGGRASCTVELVYGGQHLTGEAGDLDTPAGRARAAARATLEAASRALPGRHAHLEGALFFQHFGREYLVVSVEGTIDREHVFLAGIVAVEDSPEDAGCHAILRAVERWLTG